MLLLLVVRVDGGTEGVILKEAGVIVEEGLIAVLLLMREVRGGRVLIRDKRFFMTKVDEDPVGDPDEFGQDSRGEDVLGRLEEADEGEETFHEDEGAGGLEEGGAMEEEAEDAEKRCGRDDGELAV